MRTHAQASRDAALRRLTRVNHSLAVAALVGAGVVTDVVAHTASGHTRRTESSSAGYKPALLTPGTSSATSPHRTTKARSHRAAVHHHTSSDESLQSSSAPSTVTPSQSSSSASSSSSSAPVASPAPVVAVSGGS